MNKVLLQKLRDSIQAGTFPSQFEHFGGADLIISDDPNRPIRDPEGIVFVVSAHASALSWLVIQLKEIFSDQIDYSNKYDFYPQIGRLMKQSLKDDGHLFECMSFVVDQMIETWEPVGEHQA